MTLQMKNFGSKCNLSEKFISAISKSVIVESVLRWAKFKGDSELSKTNGKKEAKLKGIPKLEESDSAKSSVVSGLAAVCRDYYGIFPLKGKLLNVREAPFKQITKNVEINHLIKIVGLQHHNKYNNETAMKTLRYGKVMIMTDQDQDGSHIKGLLINFIHHNWSELLQQNFLKEFIIPILKATKRDEVLTSYSIPAFEEWKDFVNLELVLFSNADNVRSIPSLVDGVKPYQRKVLFACFKQNNKREEKVAQLSGFVAALSAYHHGDVSLCATIVNLAQNFVGSHNINLLEPIGQFGTRLSGFVAALSAYHHGDVSLCATIVNLAQNFVGSHNINLLEPIGQFGTRLSGDDDALLKHEYDDNKKIEPVWYIPMILVNGADGIGTGWMTKIPNYNPRELVRIIRQMTDGEEPVSILPWYKNFNGTVEDCGEQRYVTSGETTVIRPDKIEITELPIGTRTQNFKENILEPLLHGSEKTKAVNSDYNEYNTNTTVIFIITCLPGQLKNLEQQRLHKMFKLQSIIPTTSMCVFDELGCLRNGDLVVENKKRKTIVDELIKRQYAPDPIQEWKRLLQTDENEEEESEESQEEPSTGDFEKISKICQKLKEERKNELQRQRDSKLDESEATRRLTPIDLWQRDLNIFSEKLTAVEEKEKADEVGVKNKPAKKGASKAKIRLQKTMASPCGRRTLPVVSEEIKKRILSSNYF
ncbi:hypothetical protein FQA39_LY06257 [Lamprigera yunnana]|nr:hypothetical protein FQA39_LY06257 [Lamprigera yunnana]